MASVDESRDVLGEWWLPESPDVAVGGILRRSNGRVLNLELVGALSAEPKGHPFGDGEMVVHRVVFGRDVEGMHYTLCEAIEVYVSDALSPEPYRKMTRLAPRYTFVGGHFPRGSEHQWAWFRLELEGLSEWQGAGRIKPYRDREDGGIGYAFSLPEPLEIEIQGNMLAISHWLDSSLALSRAELNVRAGVRLTLAASQSCEEAWNRWLSSVVNFFSFASVGQVRLVGMVAGNAVNSPERPIGIFGPVRLSQRNQDGRNLHAEDFLIDYSSLAERSLEMFGTWMKEPDRAPLNLVSGLALEQPEQVDVRFMVIASAVEAFHRSFLDYSPVDESDHRQRLREIMDALPKQHRSFVNDRLRNSNEPSFQDRVTGILKQAERWLSGIGLRPKSLSAIVRDTRNYYIHRDEARLSRAVTDVVRLSVLTKVLYFALSIAMARRLGMTDAELIEKLPWFRPYRELREVIHQNAVDVRPWQ